MRPWRGSALAAVAVAVALTAPRPAAGQGGHWSAACSGRAYCLRVAEAVEIVQPRLGLALGGGNPVPGTASTLGLRVGTLPRTGLALRATVVGAELPPLASADADASLSFPLPGLALDGSVALFSGLTLGPTVGGFAAVDLLASAAWVPVPEGEGFAAGAPFSWALGARVGILNESFTAPGLSVSGMYRSVGDVSWGDAAFAREDAYFALRDGSVWSLRAAVGKRLFVLGTTAGVGWDRYESAVELRVRDPASGPDLQLTNEALEADRFTIFGNLSMTYVILHVVGEVGWQAGGSAFAGAPHPGMLEQGALYGGLTLRLTF